MKTVLSSRKMKIQAATIEKSLEVAGNEAGLGHGYIYRLGGRDTMSLNTVNRIAQALHCSASDLLEDVEDAQLAPAPSIAAQLRSTQRDALTPAGAPATQARPPVTVEEIERLRRERNGGGQ